MKKSKKNCWLSPFWISTLDSEKASFCIIRHQEETGLSAKDFFLLGISALMLIVFLATLLTFKRDR